ncbi:MAG: protein-L-isoaspartate(D-aspartate) O-methyltransferase [Calditrichaeota bacterium]|nr:protein-L-isoaspartate(D-aspartate) O-methyltransferase [Calditrichota bacterium]
MDNFCDARQHMVENQIKKRGIRNKTVLEAMGRVPRHLFIEKKHWSHAYNDSPVPIECSQTISQPYMVALMTELADPAADKSVLEIGTGSGYQTAILAEVFGKVFTVERHRILAEHAKQILTEMGYYNINYKIDDGSDGWGEKAPFDAVIVSAAAPVVPDSLVRQLRKTGKMVIPVGSHFQQTLQLVQKRGDSFISKAICGCVFVPLIGKQGWEE